MSNTNEQVRLNKYIAECGICSRRDADKLIEAGEIEVNGAKAVAGMKIGPDDEVKYKDKVIRPISKKVVLAYNKPIGVTCTERDEHAELTLGDVIDYPVRLNYAGRLDKDSNGLLLLTNDGDLIEALMRGSNDHEKEYVVKTDKKIDESIRNRLENGIFLKELNVTTKPCKVRLISDHKFSIVITQGLNRQIRRMCEAVGLKVEKLTRIRVASIELGNLTSGAYRELTHKEMLRLYKEAGIETE
ncbi:MAG: pseudouridine synthase [Lachnospiraceae bacterium]|nr:pseudouridine synthase [Lachnospiraceae bacterium]